MQGIRTRDLKRPIATHLKLIPKCGSAPSLKWCELMHDLRGGVHAPNFQKHDFEIMVDPGVSSNEATFWSSFEAPDP